MEIKFLSEQAFKTSYTLLHGHNFTFDTYKSERTMKFFYPEMLVKAKSMLTSRNVIESIDYNVVESVRLSALTF
jgi:hypothetical protein